LDCQGQKVVKFLQGLLIAGSLLCPNILPASAQSVQQSGPVTVGHAATWATNGVIQDGGAVMANDALSGGSTTSIASGSTYYCATAGCATTAAIASLVPFTGTASNLNAAVVTAPGGGQTVVATLMIGPYGTLVASAATCTISGTATSCSDAIHQVNVPAGQAWAVRLVTSGSAASTGGETLAFQFASAAPPPPITPYVLQSGQITSGHSAVWVTNGVLGDGGSIVVGTFTAGDLIAVNNTGGLIDSGFSTTGLVSCQGSGAFAVGIGSGQQCSTTAGSIATLNGQLLVLNVLNTTVCGNSNDTTQLVGLIARGATVIMGAANCSASQVAMSEQGQIFTGVGMGLSSLHHISGSNNDFFLIGANNGSGNFESLADMQIDGTGSVQNQGNCISIKGAYNVQLRRLYLVNCYQNAVEVTSASNGSSVGGVWVDSSYIYGWLHGDGLRLGSTIGGNVATVQQSHVIGSQIAAGPDSSSSAGIRIVATSDVEIVGTGVWNNGTKIELDFSSSIVLAGVYFHGNAETAPRDGLFITSLFGNPSVSNAVAGFISSAISGIAVHVAGTSSYNAFVGGAIDSTGGPAGTPAYPIVEEAGSDFNVFGGIAIRGSYTSSACPSISGAHTKVFAIPGCPDINSVLQGASLTGTTAVPHGQLGAGGGLGPNTTFLINAFSGAAIELAVNSTTFLTIDGSGLVVTNQAAPGTPAAGGTRLWVDATDKRFHDKNDAGSIGTTVVADAGAANNFLTAISVAGVISKAQPGFTNLSGTISVAQVGGSGASHAVPVDVAGTITWKVVPDCTDVSGNHLNYTQSTDAWSCGTSTGNAITALTGDVTATGPGSVAATLASIIAAGGPTGSATVAPIITWDAKGRLTVVSSATITPAIGSVTGLGTGVATALGVNVGSVNAFVVNSGALGSPSSAGTMPAFTLGGTISGGGQQVNNLGNVLIGTANNNVLDQVAAARPYIIQASSSTTTVAGSTAAIAIVNSNTTTNNMSQIDFAAITGASTDQYASGVIGVIHGARTNAQYPAGTFFIAISPGGATGPESVVQVNYTGLALIKANDSTGANTGAFQNPGGMWVGKRVFFPGLSAASAGLSAACVENTGEITSNTGVTTCLISGAEWKHNPRVLPDHRSTLLALVPRLFDWNDPLLPRDDIGMYAEEVAAANHKLAAFGPNGTVRTWKLEAVTTLLVQGYQRHDAEITALRTDNDNIRAEVAQLRKAAN
jgi:hypothetical protein